jgi:hypothetical protein
MLESQQTSPLSRPIKLRKLNGRRPPVLATLADAAFFLSATYSSTVIDDRAQTLTRRIRKAEHTHDGAVINEVTRQLESFLRDRGLV